MAQQPELPLDAPDYQEPTDIPNMETEVVDTGVEAQTTHNESSSEPVASAPPAPAVDISPAPEAPNLEEQQRQLQQQQQVFEAQQAREQLIQGLEREAAQMEQQLLNQGNTQEEARQTTMGHLQNRMTQIQQQQEAAQSMQVAQGKRNASIHFAKKYNLGLDDLSRLEVANDPRQMEQIAKDMSMVAAKDKEIAELKARLNPQQTFDSNTPTPAASTNDDRLLDAYLAGDRSDAATAAAAKLLGI